MRLLADRERAIITDFNFFENWSQKYEHIINLGNELPVMNDEERCAENLISGCQSQVWLHAENKNDTIEYRADSDAIMTKGIIALLIRVLSNQRPNDIIDAKLDFIKTIGLEEQLSQTRANGITPSIGPQIR